MIVTRLRQISLLLIAMAISALAFIQMFQRTAGEFPMQYAGMLALAVVLFLVLWGADCALPAVRQPVDSALRATADRHRRDHDRSH